MRNNTLGQSVINNRQWENHQQLGFIDSIPILTQIEVDYFRHHLEQTCELLGGNISRLDGAHQFFRWAWELCTHPSLLDCVEQLLGPDIIIKSSRFFYKHPDSHSFVGWHQDGFTEQESGQWVPTVWLGLTPSTADNGCLQVIPGSHHHGLVPHPKMPHHNNLTHDGTTAQTEIANITNIEMSAGCMSLHHPLMVHGSQANQSLSPRIGFSASYATASLTKSISPVAWARGGSVTGGGDLQFITKPQSCPLQEAVDAYQCALGHRIRRC
jgi:non-heme Fe2+,alpha-ketoglutarate-dependent halogenase